MRTWRIHNGYYESGVLDVERNLFIVVKREKVLSREQMLAVRRREEVIQNGKR